MEVDYVTSGGRPTIHKWHRDESGQRTHETETGFEPYFFVRENEEVNVNRHEQIVRVEEGDFLTLHGDRLKKVVCKNPKEVGGYDGVRERFSETWESDVYFRSRYWLDELEPEDQSERIRVLSFDIETDRSLDATNAPEMIISISAHDNFKDKHITFVLEPEGHTIEEKSNEDWSVYSYEDERDMLNGFIDFIKATDPDIVTAWNLDDYDGPYLVNRMKNLHIDYSEISPINRVEMSQDMSRINTVRGRAFIDMIPAFKKVYFSELESYRLNAVGANLLGLEKVQFETNISQLWRDNPEKLIEYNMRDVEIMAKLDEKFRIWETIQEIQRFVGVNLEDCVHPTRASQAYFMRMTDRKMPRKQYNEKGGKDSFSGGFVKEATPGISEMVSVLDLASQYPSTMISFNMSPEKKVDSPEATDAETISVGNGVHFEYDEQGFIPKILLELIERRDREKELRDQYEYGTEEYERHDITQYALKVIANSIYGVLGSPFFMLYDREIAASTTHIGRESINWSLTKSKEMGYEPIYSDTDSVMVSVGDSDMEVETAVDKAIKLGEYINESYDEYASNKGVDLTKFGLDRKHMFDIEAEKLYSRFFMQDAKKKYAGRVRWDEGEYVESWDWAQYGKKSDMAQVSRDLQTEFLKKLLMGADKEELREYVTNVCNMIKNQEYSIHYIGIPSKMKKEIHEYETDRPILRAAKYANEHMQEQFGAGDKPKYVYVESTPPGLPDTDVICFSEIEPPERFKVDYDKMIRKIVEAKLKRILAVLDWEFDEMYRTSSSLLDL
ncbi:MAG: DNA polymerase domain-containing protein [Halopenitus sp.]